MAEITSIRFRTADLLVPQADLPVGWRRRPGGRLRTGRSALLRVGDV